MTRGMTLFTSVRHKRESRGGGVLKKGLAEKKAGKKMLTDSSVCFYLFSGEEWRQSRLLSSEFCAEGPPRRACVESGSGPSGQPRERTHGCEGVTGKTTL